MQSSRRSFKALIQTYTISRRWYCAKSEGSTKASLYSGASPLGNPNVNATPELKQWVEMGNNVIDLHKRKRFGQALEISERMKSKGTYTFNPGQHAVHLDLVSKIHGNLQAERYFNSLSEQEKTAKAYDALLHSYVRQHQTEKALKHVKDMKEKGLALSTAAFNDIMCLYSNIRKNEEVPEVFKEMKENGVEPDNLSYRTCINSFGVRSDIEGLEKILNEMESDSRIVMDWNTYAVVANFYVEAGLTSKANVVVKKAEERLDNKDGLGYNHLISLHARLGNRDDVFRLWSLEKNTFKRTLNRDYTNFLESLVILDELEEAEKVLEEWESSSNSYDFKVPRAMIAGYIQKGLCKKAEALLLHLTETDRATTPDIWDMLAKGFLAEGDEASAFKAKKAARILSLMRNERTACVMRSALTLQSFIREALGIEAEIRI